MAVVGKVDKNVIDGLIEGRIHLNEENVKLLNWVKEDVFCEIIEAQFDYLDVVTNPLLIQDVRNIPFIYDLLKKKKYIV